MKMLRRTPSQRLARAAAAGLLALAILTVASVGPTSATASPNRASSNPMSGNGMWIWYISKSHNGNTGAIAKRAKRSRISTLFIKSGDAGNYWSQFNRSMVDAYHARGLRVCSWVFIYGTAPIAEAETAARSVAEGADCLILDVEGQYEGKYASADRFMTALRAKIGPDYPVGLASFPYAHYHPSLPYSVFLRPNGGAQYNLPQMYWKTIGVSVATVYQQTFTNNRLYNRPIAPLGQTYLRVKPKQIKRFRRWALSYGSLGVSWWSWQETTKKQWRALKGKPRPIGAPPVLWPTLKQGSKGDMVVWAQEHLVGSGQVLPITGIFGSSTANAVRSFQLARGLPVTGIIDAATWPALLTVTPASVAWGSSGYAPTTRSAAASAAANAGGLIAPESAGLPPVRDEIVPPRDRH
jgi:peptidoglycan hydrolase-like protein with peptidoglycan-binding domain